MKILIAENQSVDHNFFQNKLEDLSYTVLAAEDGLKAWEIFQKNKNKIKMVIADLAIPQMDGLALCKKIRSFVKDDYVYIIILVAKDKQKNTAGILEEVADDCIARPFDFKELLARVKAGERLVKYEKKNKDMQDVLMMSRNKLKMYPIQIPWEPIFVKIPKNLLWGWTKQQRGIIIKI